MGLNQDRSGSDRAGLRGLIVPGPAGAGIMFLSTSSLKTCVVRQALATGN
jgi:hypothetical protein